jgi:hypothetical protein
MVGTFELPVEDHGQRHENADQGDEFQCQRGGEAA